MSIGEAIVEWAGSLPRWQQVALRMLTEVENPTPAQVETLAAIALLDLGHKPPFGDGGDDAVLTEAHLGLMTAGRPKVRLVALENVSNVNRLAENQTLTFGVDGLTVVYGANGAGKSGYARVLKRTCGSRCAGKPILPNVFDEDSSLGASATLDIQIGATAQRIDWLDGKDVAPILPEVGFFDLECAAVQIAGENTVLLTPPGIDLLERFAASCTIVRERIKTYASALESQAPPIVVPPEYSGTAVETTLHGLSGSTDLDPLRKTVLLQDEEKLRLQTLVEQSKSDATEVLKNCRIVDGALAPMQSSASTLAIALDAPALEQHSARLEAVAAAQEAARLASGVLFSSEPLPEVGGDVWKVLWEAARQYSEQAAYPGREFPVVDAGAVCPLCQQVLPPEAVARFARFESHVRHAVEVALRTAMADLHDSEGQYRTARAAVSTAVPGSDAADGDCPDAATAFRKLATELEGHEHFPGEDTAKALGKAAADVCLALSAARGAVTAKALAAEEAGDPKASEARSREIAGIRARDWLESKLPQVAARVEVLKVTPLASDAEASCNTTGISHFAGRLASVYVTEKLEAAFAEELRLLQVEQLPVVLAKTATRRGASLHKVELSGADHVSPPDVLSEGEQKYVALAGFLAEIDVRADECGIVLDDPVTSLDHRWRSRVARRLAVEAAKRQVVVFTHDIVFLMDLLEEAAGLKVPSVELLLRRSRTEVGLCEEGLPWGGMTVGKRLGVLRNKAQGDQALYAKEGEGSYEPRARVTYSMLRETWERAVEEVLLNGAVERLRRSVETNRLRKVFDITEGDVAAVEAGMTKCSRYMLGHDEAAEVNEGVPLPEEVDADIAELTSWVNAVRGRR